MPSPIRVVITEDSQDPATWKEAVSQALDVGSKAQPAVQDYVLLTHTKDQLRHTSLASHLRDTLGDAALKALNAGGVVKMRAGGSLRHATLRTLGGSARNAVVIAYYAEDQMLEWLDGISGLAGIVAVPDLAGNVDGWIERWNPEIPGKAATAPAPLISDPVVEKALMSLSRWINLANGVLNPRDENYADEVLRILRAKGHALDPGKIKSWAIRNSWKPGAAAKLANLAQRIGGLKTKPSLAKFHNVQARYESWSK